jgi:hypothetical protein
MPHAQTSASFETLACGWSMSSGESQRVEPPAVSVAEAGFIVTSSRTLLMPKSEMRTSPASETSRFAWV